MKKKLAFLLVAGMTMASLAGCGGDDAAPADAAPAEEAAPAEDFYFIYSADFQDGGNTAAFYVSWSGT